MAMVGDHNTAARQPLACVAQQRDEIVLVATGDEIGQIGLICRAILHAPAKEALLARACPAEVARESAESKGGK